MRIDGIWKALLLGTIVVGAGACTKSDDETTDTDDTSDTNDTDVVPTEEDDCDDGDDNDEDGDVDCDDSDCASDADCAPEFFEPYAFGVEGAFAYFADSGQIGDATLDGSAIPPYVVVNLYEEDYFNGYDERYQCSVILTHDGGPFDIEVWDFTDAYKDSAGADQTIALTHAGFTMGTYTIDSDCTGEKAIDESVWGGDAIALVENWTWGVGIGAQRPDITDYMATNAPDTAGDYVGGGFSWDLIGDPPYWAPNLGIGFAMDSAGAIQVDGDGNGVLLTPDDILASEAGVPPTGYYRSVSFNLFYAEYLAP